MYTCPFRTKACTLSTPCAKCRQVSTHAAHVLVRFEARGTHGGRSGKEGRPPYQSKHGGYWERTAA